MRKRKNGFTMIELMAVVAIIMILTAILIPNVVRNVEEGRKARARADFDVLIKAVNLFQIDNGRLPTGLSELWSSEGGAPYIASEKEETPWGGEYELEKSGNSYKITAKDAGGKIMLESREITFGSTLSDTD